VWTSNGDSVAYLRSVVLGGPQEIYVQAADGTGDPRRIFTGSSRYKGFDLSPDGNNLVRIAYAGPGAGLLLRSDFQKKNTRTLAGTENQVDILRARISPDGTMVTYQQDNNTYVTALDGSGIAIDMSHGFATFPQWSENGLYYFHVISQGSVQRFTIDPGPIFSVADGFEEVAILGSIPPYFDVFSDGERAIIGEPVIRDATTATDSTVASSFPLHFVFNWFEELKERLQRELQLLYSCHDVGQKPASLQHRGTHRIPD